LVNLDEYYLDSKNNNYKTIKKLIRTKGSSQIHFWTVDDEGINDNNIEQRRSYKVIEYKDKQVFVKTFKAPNKKNWNIKKSIRYQAENLYFFKEFTYVPKLIFFTDESIGMDYIQAKTLKEYLAEKKIKSELNQLINDIIVKARSITQILNKHNRLYDLSYNNILVKNNKAYFIDFDYSKKQQPIDIIIKIIKDVHEGEAFFSEDGYLVYKRSFVSRIKYFMRRMCRKYKI